MSTLQKITPTTQVSQGTAVEQARALGDVNAAAYMARTYPRDVSRAVGAMQESCDQLSLAERAFFRFPRGGQQVQGASIHLARDLARCWGHITYGVKELHRGERESEMLAFAWDLQTNARAETVFIVPHTRSTRNGSQPLTDERDVYENNANMGARRLREMIFSVLPPWFVEEAKRRCVATMERGDGKTPLPKRISDMIAAYEDAGVSVPQLEKKLGKSRDQWTSADVASMGVIFTSLARNEVSVDDEFPPAELTAETLTGQAKPSPKGGDGARSAGGGE